jgi:hypothetical protein
MKTYIVNIETRKNDRDDVLGPYRTFEKAKEAMREHLDLWTDEELESYKEYDSDFNKGCIYTEEESIEIIEREME